MVVLAGCDVKDAAGRSFAADDAQRAGSRAFDREIAGDLQLTPGCECDLG